MIEATKWFPPRTYLGAHIDQNLLRQRLISVSPFPQIRQQSAIFNEFGDDPKPKTKGVFRTISKRGDRVDSRLVFAHDTVQLDQMLMAQVLHRDGLSKEFLFRTR